MPQHRFFEPCSMFTTPVEMIVHAHAAVNAINVCEMRSSIRMKQQHPTDIRCFFTKKKRKLMETWSKVGAHACCIISVKSASLQWSFFFYVSSLAPRLLYSTHTQQPGSEASRFQNALIVQCILSVNWTIVRIHLPLVKNQVTICQQIRIQQQRWNYRHLQNNFNSFWTMPWHWYNNNTNKIHQWYLSHSDKYHWKAFPFTSTCASTCCSANSLHGCNWKFNISCMAYQIFVAKIQPKICCGTLWTMCSAPLRRRKDKGWLVNRPFSNWVKLSEVLQKSFQAHISSRCCAVTWCIENQYWKSSF